MGMTLRASKEVLYVYSCVFVMISLVFLSGSNLYSHWSWGARLFFLKILGLKMYYALCRF